MGQTLKKLNAKQPSALSLFRKKKLLCEFNTFYDLNKDGVITEEDFSQAREHVCRLNGWNSGSVKYRKAKELFDEIWRTLREDADFNSDNKVTSEEWLKVWEKRAEADKKDSGEDAPTWLATYMWFRFNMYDRTGDGIVDEEEFCFVLEDFGIPAKQSRQCFLMMTKNGEKQLDYEYFCQLAEEYFNSEDESALGNFITGNLSFQS